MKTGAILLRVSTQRQAEDDKASYDVQRGDCLRFAADHGVDVAPDLVWQEIGKRDAYYTRDGLQAALQAAREHRYQVLIVWRMDRLTDDPGRLLSIVEELASYGVTVAYATEPDTNTDTPLGKWLAYTKALFQVGPERSTIALRTQQARRRYTEQGRAWASNRAPYGYQWVVDPSRTSKHGDTVLPLKERCTPDPITAPIVQQLYRWIADGRTLHWAARALSGLEDGGIHQQPTPRQYSNMAGANPNGLWLESAIAKMLKNPCYKGRYATYRTKHVPRNDGTERYMQVELPESEWVYVTPSPTPALVTPELWQQVRQRLVANKQYSSRNTSPDHRIGAEHALLYRGMARCARCHGPMEVKSVTAPDGTRVFHYRCTRNSRNLGECPGVGWKVQAKAFDRAVWAALVAVLRSPDMLTRLARRSQAHDQTLADGVTLVTPLDTYRSLQQKLEASERELENYVARSANLAPNDTALLGYELRMRSLGADVLTLRGDVARAERDAAKYERIEQAIGAWEDYLDMAHGTVDMMTTRSYGAAHKRHWLEALGARVIVQPRGVDGPLAVLQLHLTHLDIGAIAPATDAALEVPVVALPAEPWREGTPPVRPQVDVPGGIFATAMEGGEDSDAIANRSCRERNSPSRWSRRSHPIRLR